MHAKDLSVGELSTWTNVISETYPIVLSNIVKNNMLEPEKMGKALAAFDFYEYGCRVYSRKTQKETIDWEMHYGTQCIIQEMTCYRYFLDWTLGNTDKEHDNKVYAKWHDFYRRNEAEVNEYMNKVLSGYVSYVEEIHKKYPNLEHPWLNYIKERDQRKQEMENRVTEPVTTEVIGDQVANVDINQKFDQLGINRINNEEKK